MNRALYHNTSKQDLLNMWDGRVKVITYDQLANYKDINELLQPYNRVIILYYWKVYTGHWVAVFKTRKGGIEVFDSLGSTLDGQLHSIDPLFRNANGLDYPYLTALILKSGLPYRVNLIQLQRSDTDTCGLWASYRMFRDDLNLKQFQDLFPDKNTNDQKLINIIYATKFKH